jgi:hypothetical protein
MLLTTLFSTLELIFLKSILALQEIGCFLSSCTSSYLTPKGLGLPYVGFSDSRQFDVNAIISSFF